MPLLHLETGQVHIEPSILHPSETQIPPPEAGAPNLVRQAPPAQHGTVAARRPPVAAHDASGAIQTTAAAALPDAYIGKPTGDLHSDPQHAGMLIDASGQPYVPIGADYYAIRNDAANGTSRVVQLQDPTKPGIPIRQTSAGNWAPHRDTGLPGGSPDGPGSAAMRQDLQNRRDSLKQALGSLSASEQSMLAMIDRGYEKLRTYEDALRHLQAAGADGREESALIAQLRTEVERVHSSLRDVRNMQYTRLGELADVERQLCQLPVGHS
ncbi:hypothetical protein [Paraburkholderia rhizosphaerae]|uniref:Uncharacterized protein n=1 Tax=Paraburkholderia rhizosphaerae TaxID=480658 RepID=A0A4R8LJL6_9BURK|nr:hypothetical protein [Paraburkholderia rhizosphaerae]TDY42454.1 hypothetical protein BX592_12125 [Paraburkholderia rhizosphaerae]